MSVHSAAPSAEGTASPDPDVPVSTTRRVLLFLSYDGTDYSGFALQNNAPTISGELRRAILEIDPQAGKITGASRTDSGVHARNQPVSFTTEKNVSPRGWVLALAQRMPRAISVTYAAYVPLNFDPRIDPLFKRYRYRIFHSQVEDPFVCRMSWRVGQPLHLETMRSEAALLVGEHDFRAFRMVDDQRTQTIRRLDQVTLEVDPKDPRCIDLHVTGNRFMYNMVRIIAGTIVDVGRGRLAPGACSRALESGQRSDLGMTAPAHGLMLEHVELSRWDYDGWPQGPGTPRSAR